MWIKKTPAQNGAGRSWRSQHPGWLPTLFLIQQQNPECHVGSRTRQRGLPPYSWVEPLYYQIQMGYRSMNSDHLQSYGNMLNATESKCKIAHGNSLSPGNCILVTMLKYFLLYKGFLVPSCRIYLHLLLYKRFLVPPCRILRISLKRFIRGETTSRA